MTLNDAGILRVDMVSAVGVAGTDWDLLVSSGAVAAPDAGTFTIQLSGGGTGFDPGVNQSWKIMDGASVTGFDTNRFSVNTAAFTPMLHNGTFSITNDDANGDLYLAFQPSVEAADFFSVSPAGPTSRCAATF